MDELTKLEARLAELPKGTVCRKVIYGKEHFYLQWREDTKTKSKYLAPDEVDKMREAVEERRKIEKQIKLLKTQIKAQTFVKESPAFKMRVVTKDALRNLVNTTAQPQKRDCFAAIEKYLYSAPTPRICSVYGLRRTGKTTLLHQLIGNMTPDNFAKAAYIKARTTDTMAMLDSDLGILQANGYQFIFIDEITFIEDFIDTASLLSDIYAAMGMKIVISGTDSLGIWLSGKDQLYDRTYMVHTTWIPYREHVRLLGKNDIDAYIEYGGTLRAGETDFDDPELQSEDISFRDEESTRRYIDTAICQNIQHSLKCFKDGTRFMKLQKLYEVNELTNAINRIIESMNHRFTLEVLIKDFQSNDLKMSRKNFLIERDLSLRTDILERINVSEVTGHLMKILQMLNQPDAEIELTEGHVLEIKEYLKALDLIDNCPVRYQSDVAANDENVLIMQPGMRYCQAQALVYSIMADSVFKDLNDVQRNYVREKILNEIRGRMLEEIVLIETKRALGRGYEVFKYQFLGGEFDMVVYNKAENTCVLYEIKHSKEVVKNQCRHLMDEENCAIFEERMAPIRGKYVLYRGKNCMTDWEIEYLNVEEYLKQL